jgi:hypothetical protein
MIDEAQDPLQQPITAINSSQATKEEEEDGDDETFSVDVTKAFQDEMRQIYKSKLKRAAIVHSELANGKLHWFHILNHFSVVPLSWLIVFCITCFILFSIQLGISVTMLPHGSKDNPDECAESTRGRVVYMFIASLCFFTFSGIGIALFIIAGCDFVHGLRKSIASENNNNRDVNEKLKAYRHRGFHGIYIRYQFSSEARCIKQPFVSVALANYLPPTASAPERKD